VSTETVSAVVQESAANAAPLRIAGRSTWLSAGRPVRAESVLSLRDDTGVVSYVPGDLTLTIRAGTTLADVERITLEHGQWLPLDPPGSGDGSIGATVSTASAGPLSTNFGLPRDLLLGLEFVNGRGEVVRGGGKVVKNVAGFDLSRLLTGSWGTLGIITEVTVRLYARPSVDRTFMVALDVGEKANTALLRAIVVSPLAPFALEVVNAVAARRLELGEAPACLIRLGGNAAVVQAQLNALSQLARTEEVQQSVWSAFRALDSGAESVIRISTLPTRFLGTAASILADSPPEVAISINPRRGVMRIMTYAAPSSTQAHFAGAGSSFDLPSNGEITDARGQISDSGKSPDARMMFEVLPADLWPMVSPTAVGDQLSRGIKKAYDPHNLLNPGILGD
jgi:glycolate oxidase FAD binding subunit